MEDKEVKRFYEDLRKESAEIKGKLEAYSEMDLRGLVLDMLGPPSKDLYIKYLLMNYQNHELKRRMR